MPGSLRRRTARGYSVLALMIGLALLAPDAAFAHDHRSPRRALFSAGGLSQRGALVEVTWTSPSGPEECVTQSGAGVSAYPSALPVPQGQITAAIRLRKQQKPKWLHVRAWREVDANGSPVGPIEKLAYQLEPVSRRNRTVAWLAQINPVVLEDLFIVVDAKWRDEDGCGELQSAGWAFHISASSQPRPRHKTRISL